MHLRSYIYGLATAAALTAGAAAAQVARPADDAVIATVNGEPVTYRQLVGRLIDYHGEPVLDAMINRAVVKQAADREKITVSDADITGRLAQVKQLLQGEQNYRKWLQASGLTEAQHRDQMRYTILTEKLAEKQMPVTDADLERLHVRMIACADEAKAQRVIRRLRAREDFRTVALQESDDPQTKTQGGGGLLPPLHRLTFPTTWAHANKLQPGEFTREPVPVASGGFAILKLEARLPASTLKPNERQDLTRLVKAARLDQWLDQARGRAKIERPIALKDLIAAPPAPR